MIGRSAEYHASNGTISPRTPASASRQFWASTPTSGRTPSIVSKRAQSTGKALVYSPKDTSQKAAKDTACMRSLRLHGPALQRVHQAAAVLDAGQDGAVVVRRPLPQLPDRLHLPAPAACHAHSTPQDSAEHVCINGQPAYLLHFLCYDPTCLYFWVQTAQPPVRRLLKH